MNNSKEILINKNSKMDLMRLIETGSEIDKEINVILHTLMNVYDIKSGEYNLSEDCSKLIRSDCDPRDKRYNGFSKNQTNIN